MPYTKQLAGRKAGGKKESYEIKIILISLEQKEISGELDHITYDLSNTPRVNRQNFVVRNQAELIINPAWNASSTPPKPSNFDRENPDTWEGLTFDEIPRITNPEKEYFNKLVSASGSEGDNIYERIKRVIYSILIETETLPSGNEWSIE